MKLIPTNLPEVLLIEPLRTVNTGDSDASELTAVERRL